MIPSPLTDRWMKMFCMDELAIHFDMEYWDCSVICTPSFAASSCVERDYVRKIGSIGEMKKKLGRLPTDTIIVSHIHLDGFNYQLHKTISRYIKTRVYVDFWANDISGFLYGITSGDDIGISSHSLFGRIKNQLRKIDGLYYLYLIVKCLKRGYGKKEFYTKLDKRNRFIRYEKSASLYNNVNITVLPRQRYSINHPDYEKYVTLVTSNCGSLVSGEYIVFIDQYYPLHPTLKSEDPNVDFSELVSPYFASLNSFFDRVEEEYHCPVVIAGHPIAKYDKNPFGGRRIMYFKTAELVQYSKAVLMHNSYSVSFVLLFDKPFCLLTNWAHRQSTETQRKIMLFGEAFNKEFIDVDNVNDVRGLFQKAKKEIRDKYINAFFDTTVMQKNDSILTNHLKNIHDDIIVPLLNDK